MPNRYHLPSVTFTKTQILEFLPPVQVGPTKHGLCWSHRLGLSQAPSPVSFTASKCSVQGLRLLECSLAAYPVQEGSLFTAGWWHHLRASSQEWRQWPDLISSSSVLCWLGMGGGWGNTWALKKGKKKNQWELRVSEWQGTKGGASPRCQKSLEAVADYKPPSM